MASDYFVKLDGIDGESNDKGHSKWIEVLAFTHGAAQNISMSRGVDVAGRGQFTAFTFVHALDKAVPKLLHFCMSGQKISKVEFHVCRAIAGAQVPVYEVTLENVKIGKVTVDTIDCDGTKQPVSNVELCAAKETWKFTAIKPDNTKDGAVEANFDQVANS